MPMGKGIWYNPRTEQVVDVASDGSYTHDVWIRKPKNAEWIGLSSSAQEFIAQANDIDEIRKAAIRDGLVRAREYKNYVSVTLSYEQDGDALLLRVYRIVEEHYGRYSSVKLHNLATEDSIAIFLPDLKRDFKEGLRET